MSRTRNCGDRLGEIPIDTCSFIPMKVHVNVQRSGFHSSPAMRGALRLALALGLAASLAHAQVTFRYFYDSNHQLFRVLDSTGNLIEYDYDLAGNPTQIKRSVVSRSSLSILNIVPSRGTAGQTITIYGQNFDTLAAGDTVKFDGVVATVVSATATSLVVLVPTRVTTGPVTVTVGGSTASSGSLDFTVPPLPVITSISPNTGYPGQTLTGVTVTGTNLTGATFELSSGAYTNGLITNVNVTSSTQATFNLSTGQVPGDFVLIANAPSGLSSSVPTPGNTLQIYYPPGDNYAIEMLSVFNANVPPGTDPGVPTGSNQADQVLSIFNAYLTPGTAPGVPVGSNEAFQLFSVTNNCGNTCPQDALRLVIKPTAGTGPTALSNAARTELTTGTTDTTLIAGQTVQNRHWVDSPDPIPGVRREQCGIGVVVEWIARLPVHGSARAKLTRTPGPWAQRGRQGERLGAAANCGDCRPRPFHQRTRAGCRWQTRFRRHRNLAG